MKKIINESIKKLIEDRQLLVTLVVLLLVSIFFSVILGFVIQPSDVQLIIHYSAFGESHLYRDQWFYLINFILFEIFIATIHSSLSIKMLVVKDRNIAILFAWLGIAICTIGFIISLTLINVWKPL